MERLGCPSGFCALQESTQSRLRLLVVLKFQERDQFLPDEFLIEPAVLPEGDPFDVDPVLGTARERLEDDEVFGAADYQGDTFSHAEDRSPTHSLLLEGHCPQDHVKRDSVPAKQQEDPMSQREFAGIGDASLEDG